MSCAPDNRKLVGNQFMCRQKYIMGLSILNLGKYFFARKYTANREISFSTFKQYQNYQSTPKTVEVTTSLSK